MSAFCIYSVSRLDCLNRAKAKVPTFVVDSRNKPVRQMTQAEWTNSAGMVAAALYSKAKPTAVSPKFDAPQFALDWARLAMRQGIIENWQLFGLQPTGQKDPKTKNDVLAWRRYATASAA